MAPGPASGRRRDRGGPGGRRAGGRGGPTVRGRAGLRAQLDGLGTRRFDTDRATRLDDDGDLRLAVDRGGTPALLPARLGIRDDEVGRQGSATFTMVDDGRQLAANDVVRGGQPAVDLTAEVTGVHTLGLVVGDGGDGKKFDHAGRAQLTCAG